jgi:hypothetical protein
MGKIGDRARILQIKNPGDINRGFYLQKVAEVHGNQIPGVVALVVNVNVYL